MKLVFTLFFLNLSLSITVNATINCNSLTQANKSRAKTIETLTQLADNKLLVNKYYYAQYYAEKVTQVTTGTQFENTEVIGKIRKNTERINIEKLMVDYQLSRYQAVEVQALLRRNTTEPNDAQLETAIEAVKNGLSLSNLNQEKIKQSPFTLVLDVDGTLLDQDSNLKFIPHLHERSFLIDGKKINHVALNPGALTLIKKAKELGGAVVLFSRNNDLLIEEIVNSLQYENQPLASQFDGILTSSHMVIPESLVKNIGTHKFSRLLKKDLRVIESDRIILIDDNPDYVLQLEQLRVVNEFSLNGPIAPPFQITPLNKVRQDSSIKKNKVTAEDMEKLDRYILKVEKEYQKIIEQLIYLTKDLESFRLKQTVFSPLGSEALSLLTGRNSNYRANIKQSMDTKEAAEYLLSDPYRVKETINQKIEIKKERAKKQKKIETAQSLRNKDIITDDPVNNKKNKEKPRLKIKRSFLNF